MQQTAGNRVTSHTYATLTSHPAAPKIGIHRETGMFLDLGSRLSCIGESCGAVARF